MYPHDKLDWQTSRLEKRLAEASDDVSARLEYASLALSRAAFHGGGEMWFNRALTAARRALQEDPGSPRALAVAGHALAGMERLEPATRYLDEAMRAGPDRPEVHLAMGVMYELRGERHQAIRAFEAACRLSPESWEAHHHLGRALWNRATELGRPTRLVERAQFHSVRALRLGASPELSGELLYRLGVTAMHLGRFTEAHKIFLRLADDETWKIKSEYFLGLVSYQLGKYKNAVLYLRQHADHVGENAQVLGRIAMAYLQLGEIAKGREACNRALALEPGDLQARWTLGCALLEEDRRDEATRLFKEILAEAPNHAAAFAELVRIRTASSDLRWLRAALRAEVTNLDRLPPSTAPSDARASTRSRISTLLRAIAEVEAQSDNKRGDVDATRAILETLDLTTDEGLRFQLWEAALDLVGSRRARTLTSALDNPGHFYAARTGREILSLASLLPEKYLTKGLNVGEDDLRRAAVDRHGPAHDVAKHREAVEHERREARAWQALLLLSIGARQDRASRNLLLRWASEADKDLAAAAQAALVVMGDTEAITSLRQHAHGAAATHLVDAIVAQVAPPRAHYHARAVSDDPSAVCSTCGRRGSEVGHVMVGGDATVCDVCMADLARTRSDHATDDADARCALTGRSALDSRGLYVYRGIGICREVLDQSLGLLEREEVDRYLAVF